jgi:hypothetical protein
MSSWGHGNFEDDDALDYVDALIRKLASDLDRAAAKRRLSGDEVLTSCIPRLAVLALLVKGANTPGPEAVRLDRWRAAFRAGFDRDSGDMFDDPAHARGRWRVIERTFAELKKRAFVPEG